MQLRRDRIDDAGANWTRPRRCCQTGGSCELPPFARCRSLRWPLDQRPPRARPADWNQLQNGYGVRERESWRARDPPLHAVHVSTYRSVRSSGRRRSRGRCRPKLLASHHLAAPPTSESHEVGFLHARR